jgi:hypothetical protein
MFRQCGSDGGWLMVADNTFPVDRYRLPAVSRRSSPRDRNPLQTGGVGVRCFSGRKRHRLAKDMNMDDEIRIQDLATDEIRELLLEEGSEVDEQQAADLKQFIQEIGGLENALAAIAMLEGLEEAA